jgi:RNA polymerase sigma-70 factor (ECF subfamily)
MEEKTAGAAILTDAPLLQDSGVELDDRILLRRYVESGDRDAMGCLLLRHADLSFRLALRFLKNAADAEDAVQSAFIEVLRHASTFDNANGAGVKAWIMGFVINTCQHKSREQFRRKRRERESSDKLEAVKMDSDSQEIHSVLRSAIEKLPEHYRIPIWLHYFEGLSVSEAAVALRQPPDTVRKQLNRGLDRLRLALAGLGLATLEFSLVDASSSLAAPEPVAAAVRSFVETGKFPAVSSGAGEVARQAGRLAAKKSVAAGMKALAGAVMAGGVICASAAWLSARGTQTAPTAPNPVPPAPAIVSSVEYEDDFKKDELSDFWERVSRREKVRTGTRPECIPALVVAATPGAGTELISRRVSLNNAPLEISATRLFFEIGRIATGSAGVEFYFEIQDADGHALLRTMNLEQNIAGGPPFAAFTAMQTLLDPRHGVVNNLEHRWYIDPSGRIAERLPDGRLVELGTVKGGVAAVKLRLYARSGPNSEYCISASNIRVRHVAAWPAESSAEVRSSKE